MARDLFDHERLVEQKIQDAIRDGLFDDLPRGRLAELDRDYEPNWWLKRLMEREDLARVARVPKAPDLRDRLALIEELCDEDAVRRATRELNAELVERLGRGGPRVPRIDPEVMVQRWRRRRKRRE